MEYFDISVDDEFLCFQIEGPTKNQNWEKNKNYNWKGMQLLQEPGDSQKEASEHLQSFFPGVQARGWEFGVSTGHRPLLGERN